MRLLRAFIVAVIMATALLAPNALPARADAGLKQVQMNLAGLGYLAYGDADGQDGPKTSRAVFNFQTNRCLERDGIAGRNTTAALSNLIRRVQKHVGTTADGSNGPKTKAAIVRYQKDKHLKADGQAGRRTLERMGEAYSLSCSFPIDGSTIGGRVTRSEVLARALYWVDKRVPYHQRRFAWDLGRTKRYRQDCSGMVSMALHMDGNYTTVTLAKKLTRISRDELRPGDIVGNLGNGGSSRHTMIFWKWIDKKNNTFLSIEQRDWGQVAQVKLRTYGSYYGTRGAWRYPKVAN